MVVVGIAIALVFINKNKENNSFSNNEIKNSESQTDVTYATSFSLNLPNTINILVGAKAILSNGYVEVTPSSMLEKLSYEVTPKASGVVNGIKFNNNVIEANIVGNYTIKFKMPKSASVYFSRTINVAVYDEKVNSHIYQTGDTMIIGESKNVSEMFSVINNPNFTVTTDGNTTYLNNKIIAQNVSESNLTFKFIENYVEYVYEFTVRIKDEPMFKIVLLNVTNNIINIDLSDNDVRFINFQIKNREEENVTQAIRVSSSNEDVVIDETETDDVLIKIRALSTGEATITISLVSDETINVEIRVIVN